MTGHLTWHGDEISARLERIIPIAIDATTEEAVLYAKASHWWRSRKGRLQGEIANEPARRTGAFSWTGRFGSTQRRGFYGLILEYRQPFLRPAAQATFKHLSDRIRRAF